MPPAPLPAHEAQRLSALLACNVLDTPPEQGFDDLTRLARKLCDAPIALISLLDENRQWFKSRVGLDITQTPRDAAFCGYAILQQGPIVIEDARTDERTHDNPLVAGPPGIRFYAGVPLVVEGGLPLGTLCVIDTRPRRISQAMLDDLTALGRQAACQLELRRAIGVVQDAHAKAEQANHAKSAFLSHMSHELRTPLTSIVGYADLLLDNTAALGEEAAQAIARNASHLLEIVNDILDVSKIESGMMHVEHARVDPRTVIAQAVQLTTHSAQAKGLRIETNFTTAIPNDIASDALRLRQILINLLANAIKFTDQGAITITINANPQTNQLHAIVQDTGIGMTPQQVQRIQRFEAFQQADVSTSRRYGGTGLGLRIAHSLAKLLGGALTVESRIGHGSAFTLTLPIEPANTAWATTQESQLAYQKALQQTTSNPRTQPKHESPLSGLHVLIAEDSPDNQRLLEHHLRRAGATVDKASNGYEAIDHVQRNGPYDCILMDLEMPGLDGCQATTKLRDAGYEAPIVFLSAHTTAECQAQALKAGGDDFMTKPVDPARLIETCRKWAARRNAQAKP